MPLPENTYDLTIVLDPQAEDTASAKIIADTRASIEAGGELLRQDDWGERPLAYPIRRRSSGHYHLLQFHPGSAELLSELNRTLHITDGILRFRIIKLPPGVPEAPNLAAAPARPAEPEAQPAAEPAPATAPA